MNDIGRKKPYIHQEALNIYFLEIHIKIYNDLNAHNIILHISVNKKFIRRDVIDREETVKLTDLGVDSCCGVFIMMDETGYGLIYLFCTRRKPTVFYT